MHRDLLEVLHGLSDRPAAADPRGRIGVRVLRRGAAPPAPPPENGDAHVLPELWSSLEQVVQTIVATVLIYAGAVAALRLAGRRTLAQMSAFDVVVTVAIGSTMASTLVPPEPAVSDGFAVLGGLLVSQVAVAAVRQRFPGTRRLLDFAPRAIFRNGTFDLRSSPASAQVTQDELFSMLRRQGIFDLSDVQVVVLEPTGTISVARSEMPPDSEIMRGVDNR